MIEEPSRKMYFGTNVDDAIVAYNSTESPSEREKLFSRIIYPAFTELVRQLIHKSIRNQRPYYTDSTYEDTTHECVVYLFEKIGGFNPSMGRAFSYFNHISMMWLMGRSQSVYSDVTKKADLEEVDTSRNINAEESFSDSSSELQDFIRAWAKSCNARLDVLFRKKNQRRIANAIFNLFEDCEYIDIYNKKALYILVREQVDVKTHMITTVVNEIKTLFTNMHTAHLNKNRKKERYEF